MASGRHSVMIDWSGISGCPLAVPQPSDGSAGRLVADDGTFSILRLYSGIGVPTVAYRSDPSTPTESAWARQDVALLFSHGTPILLATSAPAPTPAPGERANHDMAQKRKAGVGRKSSPTSRSPRDGTRQPSSGHAPGAGSRKHGPADRSGTLAPRCNRGTGPRQADAWFRRPLP